MPSCALSQTVNRGRVIAFCSKRTNICWTNQPTPPAQDSERHLTHSSTGWIAPALYKLRWIFSAPLNNFRCQLSRRFWEIGRTGKAYFVTSLVPTPSSTTTTATTTTQTLTSTVHLDLEFGRRKNEHELAYIMSREGFCFHKSCCYVGCSI